MEDSGAVSDVAAGLGREAGGAAARFGYTLGRRIVFRRQGTLPSGAARARAIRAVGGHVSEGVVGLAPGRAPERGTTGHGSFALHVFFGQFLDKAAGYRTGPLAIDAAVCGVKDRAAALGARDRDIGEAALFLEAGQPAFVDSALAGKDAFFPTGEEDMIEFQSLGRMHGHDGDFLTVIGPFIVHHQADMFEEIAKRVVFFHGAGKFGQVFEATRAFGAAILLQHVLVTAFGNHRAQQFGRRNLFR